MNKFIYLACWIGNILLLIIKFNWLGLPAMYTGIVGFFYVGIGAYIFYVPAIYLTAMNYVIVTKHRDYWSYRWLLLLGPFFNLLFLWKVLQSRWI